MRLAVVSGTFYPEASGPATYLWGLLRDLAGRGLSIRVVTYGDRTEERYPYAVRRISRALPLPIRVALFAAEAASHARWSEVTYVNDYAAPVFLTRPLHRRRYVLKVVGDYAWERAVTRGVVPAAMSIDDFQRADLPLIARLWRRGQALYVRAAHRVITPSEYLARLVLGWGADPRRIRVVRNALNPATLPELPPRAAARTLLGLPRDAPIAVVSARLTRWKRVDEVIRAMRAVRGRVAGAELHVIGDGPVRRELEELSHRIGLREAVHFHGELPREQALLHLRAADVLVLYSSYEGLSHVLLEAAVLGTAIVTSDAGGNPEVVVNGHSGLLVPARDPSPLAESVALVLSDEMLRTRLAAAARERIQTMFTWSHLVRDTVDVLEECRHARGA